MMLLTGMRTRSPKSLLAGLMWFDPQRPDALSNIRHNAQERDGTFLTFLMQRSLQGCYLC